MKTYQVSGTPSGIPYPFAWDGSLWTLYWEFRCYVGIALLALFGLLFRRELVLAIAVFVWFVEIGLFFYPSPIYNAQFDARFSSIFLVGVLLYLYRDRVPDSSALAGGFFVLSVVGCLTPIIHEGAVKHRFFRLWVADVAVRRSTTLVSALERSPVEFRQCKMTHEV